MIAIANTRKSDTYLLAAVTTLLSVASLLYFYSHDKILLYGDAVAHINIARRVFDSQFPGLSQLGTVWLPLPHLLMLPFIVNDKLWSSGIGGSLVSMVAYIAGAIGLAKIFWTSGLFDADGGSETVVRVSGWIAALVYLLNPSLLYLESTAMTEPLGLALMIWAVYFYCRSVAEQRKALLEAIDEESAGIHEQAAGAAMNRCAVVLMAAMLTRYDYWFLAAAVSFAILFQLFVRHRVRLVRYKDEIQKRLRNRFITFVAMLAIVPAFWLTYNQALFGNAMEFANGKYSARAIAERSILQGNPPHPGDGNLKVAATYYWKTVRINVGDNRLATVVVAVALMGAFALGLSEFMLAVLLAFPLIFYTFSIAHGGIPIFVPQWWPFSYYNVRYGIQMLPAIAVGYGYAVYLLGKSWDSRKAQRTFAALLVVAIGATYAIDWHHGPACLREAEINSTGRIELHRQLAAALRALPSDSTFVVSLTEHVGAFQRAGIPLQRTWNESSHRSGEQEFAFPLTQGDYVVAFDGDPVARVVAENPVSVERVASFYVPGEKRCVIYKATRNGR